MRARFTVAATSIALRCLGLAACGLLVGALLPACENSVVDDAGAFAGAGLVPDGETEALTATCAPGSTVKGIDVSRWQGAIDWRRVAGDGIAYAIIRVSDGTGSIDGRFSDNWQQARDNGIQRGAYQFFRSNQDAIAQADLLIDAIGTLEPGDLPPVIDVESTDGQSNASIARKVGAWMDRVKARLGVTPIVYTGPYFWRDRVASDAVVGSPLWIAHYGTDCPLVPEPWSTWTFHQYTDSGRVAGIDGTVDMNLFNGTRAQLRALGVGGSGAVTPTPTTPPAAEACATLPSAGGVLEEDDACATLGGPSQYLRVETGKGHEGLVWTYATSGNSADNFAEYEVKPATEGDYLLELYVDNTVASSRKTRIEVTHAGRTDVVTLDQASTNGYLRVGIFHFEAGSGQGIRIGDNTGEAYSQRRVIVFDALRVTRSATAAPPPTTTPETSCSRLKVVDTSSLNVRPTPSTSRRPRGSLRRGQVVERLDTVNGQSIQGDRRWHRIRAGNLTGYVTAVYMDCAG